MDATTAVITPSQEPPRRPVLKISPEPVYTPTSPSAYSYQHTSPTTLASAQGSHCCGCGGMFVISNRCSNRDCKHLQCSECK